MKLAAKLITTSVVVMIAVIAISNYFSVQRAEARFRRNHEYYAQNMTSQIEKDLAAAHRSGGMDEVNKHLAGTEAKPIARWVWFDETVTATTRPYASVDFRKVMARRRVFSVISSQVDGPRRLDTYCPIELANGREGGLEFTKDLEDLDWHHQDERFESILAVGAMVLLAIAVVMIAGVRLVARPLKKLTEATWRIGQGDFSQPVELSGHDEFSKLAAAINEMSAKLQQQKNIIEQETGKKIRALQQLRHADRLKTVGRMAAVIAHELGTPLSVVSGRASLIAGGNLSETKLKENASAIQKEAENISDKIRQLLDFARQEPSEKSEVDLHNVVTQTFDLLRPLAEKQKINARFSLANEKAVALGNSAQIQQVLTNIMMNAIQAMPHGGSLEISTSRHQTAVKSALPETFWVISIADQGFGISPSDLESIFEPFYTTKDVGQGTGLGLSIAYNIVQEHQGWIDVESKPGSGSRFSVYLPMAG